MYLFKNSLRERGGKNNVENTQYCLIYRLIKTFIFTKSSLQMNLGSLHNLCSLFWKMANIRIISECMNTYTSTRYTLNLQYFTLNRSILDWPCCHLYNLSLWHPMWKVGEKNRYILANNKWSTTCNKATVKVKVSSFFNLLCT